MKVSWKPPALDFKPSSTLPDEYLESLKPASDVEPDHSLPMEHFLEIELANPHSRAKKQKRWQQRLASLDKMRTDMIKAEVADLDGRSRREARAEGEWKFRERVAKMEKAQWMRQMFQRGIPQKVGRRRARKARKAERRLQKLRETVLVAEGNQVIPTSYQAPKAQS